MSRQILNDISSSINILPLPVPIKTEVESSLAQHFNPLPRPTHLPSLPAYWSVSTEAETESQDDRIPMLYIVHTLPMYASSHYLNKDTASHFVAISALREIGPTLQVVSDRFQFSIKDVKVLVPIHDIILATSCANLPVEAFLNATAHSCKINEKGVMTWQVPDPSTFIILLEWIYYRDQGRLEFSLDTLVKQQTKLAQESNENTSMKTIIKDILIGLSNNGRALGVYNHPEVIRSGLHLGHFDKCKHVPGLWDILDTIWEALHV